MKITILGLIFSLCLTFLTGLWIIPRLRKLKAGQPILKYVETHKDKSGTPTMGGLFFIISSCVSYFLLNGIGNRTTLVSIVICLSFMVVGFLDDFIKIKFKHNEGLKAYQKICFLFVIALIAGIYSYKNGLIVFFIPFSFDTVVLGYWTIPIVMFIFVSITNSVNLTDGLDGLASSSSIVYLFFLSILIYLEFNLTGGVYLTQENVISLIRLSFCFIGGLLGFLIFNVNKAKVFMGDTGSLALGGLIGTISVFSLNSFMIPILGFVFVFSALSVIIQVGYYKKTKKRVFLMAPFHHHLQMKGLSEAKITYLYSLVTGILGILLIIFYL